MHDFFKANLQKVYFFLVFYSFYDYVCSIKL